MRNKNKEVKELKKDKSLIGAAIPRSARMKMISRSNPKDLGSTENNASIKTRESIANYLIKIFEEKGITTVFTDTTTIVDDLGVDSLDVVEIVVALEEKFEISVPDEVYPNFNTVGDIINYVAENKK